MVERGPHLAYRKSECWKLSASRCARRSSIPTPAGERQTPKTPEATHPTHNRDRPRQGNPQDRGTPKTDHAKTGTGQDSNPPRQEHLEDSARPRPPTQKGAARCPRLPVLGSRWGTGTGEDALPRAGPNKAVERTAPSGSFFPCGRRCLGAAAHRRRSAAVHIMRHGRRYLSFHFPHKELINITSHDEMISCTLSWTVCGVFPGSVRPG